jgi:hypothetical protein
VFWHELNALQPMSQSPLTCEPAMRSWLLDAGGRLLPVVVGDGFIRTEGRPMRLRSRTLMIAVAASAIVLGLVIHIQVLRRDEDDFAMPILMLEGIAVSVLLAIVLPVVSVVRVAREDDPRVHR